MYFILRFGLCKTPQIAIFQEVFICSNSLHLNQLLGSVEGGSLICNTEMKLELLGLLLSNFPHNQCVGTKPPQGSCGPGE